MTHRNKKNQKKNQPQHISVLVVVVYACVLQLGLAIGKPTLKCLIHHDSAKVNNPAFPLLSLYSTL